MGVTIPSPSGGLGLYSTIKYLLDSLSFRGRLAKRQVSGARPRADAARPGWRGEACHRRHPTATAAESDRLGTLCKASPISLGRCGPFVPITRVRPQCCLARHRVSVGALAVEWLWWACLGSEAEASILAATAGADGTKSDRCPIWMVALKWIQPRSFPTSLPRRGHGARGRSFHGV